MTATRPRPITAASKPKKTKTAELTIAQRLRLSLAVHEAAHACVGVLHGAELECARLIGDGPDAEGECCFTASSFEVGRLAAGHRSEIAAAGAVAEAVFRFGFEGATFRRIEARLVDSDDEQQLRVESWRTLRSAPETFSDVLPLVKQLWTPIGELARKLYFGAELNHSDVCAALNVTDGGGPYSGQLHSVRRGYVALSAV